jgi:hypothetical protein
MLLTAAAALFAAGASAQQVPVPDWSRTAARGMFDVCREDAPDAAKVAGHLEVWGWPAFAGYTEHLEGYRRLQGGESRRVYEAEGQTGFVEGTVQSGVVTSAAPADIRYFRCNVASDQDLAADLKAYFTGAYGPPTSDTSDAVVWLTKSAATTGATGQGPDAEADALHAVAAAAAGSEGMRIELSRDNGLDRAKLTFFLHMPPGSPAP